MSSLIIADSTFIDNHSLFKSNCISFSGISCYFASNKISKKNSNFLKKKKKKGMNSFEILESISIPNPRAQGLLSWEAALNLREPPYL